jgi:hypothetical protein
MMIYALVRNWALAYAADAAGRVLPACAIHYSGRHRGRRCPSDSRKDCRDGQAASPSWSRSLPRAELSVRAPHDVLAEAF